MATASIQISNLHPSLAIYGEPNVFNRGSKTVGMHRVQHPSVSSSIIKSLSGLRGHNSFDSHNRSQSRYLEIPNSMSRRRGGVNEMVFPKAMFERFNVEAYKVIMRAQEEARRLGHNFVGTEHILLGLINEGCIVDEVLTCVTLSDARFEVEKMGIGEGSGFVDADIYFTHRTERLVSGLSLEEAQELGHNYVGPEHLLLGILREGEQSVGARVLENLGVDLSNTRKQVIKKLSRCDNEMLDSS